MVVVAQRQPSLRRRAPAAPRRSAVGEAVAALFLCAVALLVISLCRACPRQPPPTGAPRAPGDALSVSARPLPPGVAYGNAHLDGQHHMGWFVGHFTSNDTLQHSSDVEVKFSVSPAGRRNEGVAQNRLSRTMTLLLAGMHRLEFDNSSVVLERPGDYVIFAAGVRHSWQSITDSTVLTIRWPSIPGDQVRYGQSLSV